MQAQQNDLETFLGWYLYNEFIEDYDGPMGLEPMSFKEMTKLKTALADFYTEHEDSEA